MSGQSSRVAKSATRRTAVTLKDADKRPISRKSNSIYIIESYLIFLAEKENQRPSRANAGKGGYVAQLSKAFDDIRPGEFDGNKKITKSKSKAKVDESVPVNPMAPDDSKHKRRTAAKVCIHYVNDHTVMLICFFVYFLLSAASRSKGKCCQRGKSSCTSGS